MALQVLKAALLGVGHHFGVQILVAGDEGDVHQGADFLVHGALEELGGIQEVVHHLGLLLVDLVHGLQAADLLQVLEHLAAAVDGPAVGGVVHGAVVGVDLVVHIGGDRGGQIVPDQVLPDDDHHHAGGAHVLLDAGVDEAVVGDVAGLGEEHAALVADQDMALGVGQPLHNIEICSVHPETHERLPQGEMGEICIHGPNVFAGYLGKKSTDSFIQLDNKIWYRSGDMGYINEDGYLILGGRLKRFIKIGGEMISLEAVEQELKKVAKQRHWVSSVDDKASLALIGFEKYEGKPYLVLFTTFTANRDEINTVLRDSGFGRIVKIAEVQKLPEIPLTGTGKVHYRVLEEKLLDKS